MSIFNTDSRLFRLINESVIVAMLINVFVPAVMASEQLNNRAHQEYGFSHFSTTPTSPAALIQDAAPPKEAKICGH